MKGTCKLCTQKKVLRQSHILPEFMYGTLYDKNPRRFFEVNVNTGDPEKNSRRIEQKGLREYLLCQDCETKLSKYERYADETMYSKNRGNRTQLNDALITEEGKYFVYEFSGFDYNKFKLFLMSLFWRLLISNRLTDIEGDKKMLEDLRKAIYYENPLEPEEYGCLVQSIKYKPDQRATGFILAPYLVESEYGLSFNQLVDGLMYTFFFDYGKLNSFIKSFFIKNDGTMRVFGRYLWDDPDLSRRVKLAFDYLGTYDDNPTKKP